MNDMEYVNDVIDGFIKDIESRCDDEDLDALDKSYCRCMIGTLKMLKNRLGIT